MRLDSFQHQETGQHYFSDDTVVLQHHTAEMEKGLRVIVSTILASSKTLDPVT